jgi:AcrR family transcriptional regulator
MTAKKSTKNLDESTEEQIKNAARKVFHQKGFAATRTRDIAEEAGLNLALLNYYFRSKQKLFEIIMLETMSRFLQSMTFVFNDENTSLEQKLELVADKYIDLLIKEPEVPLFILSEIRNNSAEFAQKLPVKEILIKSAMARQFHDPKTQEKLGNIHPLHVMVNLMSLIVFPFIASPVLKNVGGMDDNQFAALMIQRKKLIPMWVKSMFDV